VIDPTHPEPHDGRDDEVVRLRADVARLTEHVERLRALLADKDRAIIDLRRTLAALQITVGWRALERFRILRARIIHVPVLSHGYWAFRRTIEVILDEGFSGVAAKARHKVALAVRGRSFLVDPRAPAAHEVNRQYRVWVRRSAIDPRAVRARIARFHLTPLASLLLVVDGDEAERIERTLRSVSAQLYERWELCVVSRRPLEAATAATAERVIATERRVRLVDREDRDGAHERALAAANGDFIAFVEPGDELAPEALAELVGRLNDAPDLDVVYSDEDALSESGDRVDPFFKPDWSPELLLSTDYISRLALVRARLAREVGGIRTELADGHVYDLMLRVTDRTTRIDHVAKVLYHRRCPGPVANGTPQVAVADTVNEMERHAITDALHRRGLAADVGVIPTVTGWPRHYAPRLRTSSVALVSIVIPTRDKRYLLEQSITSLLLRTEYSRYEIIVIDNDSTERDTLEYLDSLRPPCRVYRWPGAFNFSEVNNFGVQQAKGEQFLFLNNDIEVVEPGWLTAMLEHAERPEVGVVGARLLYPDGRIQHAGVVVGINRAAANAFRQWPGDHAGKPRLADVLRDCSAVTAACMMVPRRVFEEVGGFDPRLRVVFNDVDLCLRIRERGYRVIYTPFAMLHHFEGASRGRLHPTPDHQLFQARWAHVLEQGDPFYNPNLSDTRDDWSVRF
jgi:GT2 family glycosyltransferase